MIGKELTCFGHRWYKSFVVCVCVWFVTRKLSMQHCLTANGSGVFKVFYHNLMLQCWNRTPYEFDTS